MTRIDGAVVFLTGARGGIGVALIDALRAQGARRIYASDVKPADSVGDGTTVPLVLDITDARAVAEAARQASDVGVLINNAGVNLRNSAIQGSIDAARREMEVNYFGTAAMCRAFAPVLAANGGGAIVNVLSILAKIAIPALGTYCASKAALLRLTEAVRAELAAQRTHVLAAMPWAVDTPMSGPFPGEKTPPAEVAAGILAALARGDEEVYFHTVSAEINRGLAADPKAVERTYASWLPRKTEP